jgi:hypothetical protein
LARAPRGVGCYHFRGFCYHSGPVSAEATLKRCNGLARRFPRGLRSDGGRAKGSPRNLGDPWSPRYEAGRATGEQSARPAGVRSPTTRGSERKDATAVLLERRQRSEAGGVMGSRSASKVPVKRGERPRDPVEGRGAPGHGTAGGQGHADADLRHGLHTTRRIASCSQPVYPTSRMRQPARPDPWEAWVGNHPGPPGKPALLRG